MKNILKVTEIKIGYHPDGYRIDRTASPLNFYTQWTIGEDGVWHSPKPVDFNVFPENGWIQSEGFDWNRDNKTGS